MFKSRPVKFVAIGIGLLALLCLGLFVFGLYLANTPEGKATATANAAVREETRAEETAVSIAGATEAARPTDTAVPTNTPSPTDTAVPTSTPTPKPTSTPVPPTSTPTQLPEPVVYTGSGDTIVDVDKTDAPMLVRIEGNTGSRHFAVTSYDANNQAIDLLVNTTSPYAGVRPLDFLDGEHTARFEVTAVGEWTITIYPVQLADTIDVPGSFAGEGDNVLTLSGAAPDTAVISGNANSRHFAVTGCGSGINLLVNTTEPYDGTVLLDPETFLLQVVAEGEWAIEINER